MSKGELLVLVIYAPVTGGKYTGHGQTRQPPLSRRSQSKTQWNKETRGWGWRKRGMTALSFLPGCNELVFPCCCPNKAILSRAAFAKISQEKKKKKKRSVETELTRSIISAGVPYRPPPPITRISAPLSPVATHACASLGRHEYSGHTT